MDLVIQAKSLAQDTRLRILMDFRETELHENLKELFQAMEPDYYVEITHGPSELGKDLVILKPDKFSLEVIGVVVKCGDISGRTAGDVEDIASRVESALSKGDERRLREIESQLKQSQVHEAKLKSVYQNLPISTVYVVLAGKLSNQARTRLQKEPSIKTAVFDIHWLIDKFTEFYPQVFFEGQAIDFVQRKTLELERNYGLEKMGKTLSEYYVEPLIVTFSDPINFDEPSPEALKILLNRKRVPFSRLSKMCAHQTKLVLLGDPGTGKTGAMAKLAISMYQNAYQTLIKTPDRTGKPTEINIPILVTAQKLHESDSVAQLVGSYFESEVVFDRFGINVIMVDGLDEIESEHRKSVIAKLDAFSIEIGCSYILTSRRIDVIETLPQQYQKYEILPFEFSHAMQLFTKLISDKKVLDTMKDGLERIQAQLLLVPLSLMLLIELVETHKEIPASVTELYDRFFDMALGRWDREKGIAVLFEYLIKKRFLGELAYNEFRGKNRLEIPAGDFEEFTTYYGDQYDWDSQSRSVFLQEIERTGILNLREKTNFKHRSFLDYFVAYHIYENREELPDLNELITHLYFHSIWGEVAFFYIGLRREISQELLSNIHSYQNDSTTTQIDKFISGRLLQAGWHSPAQLQVSGIEHAIAQVPFVREVFQEIIDSSKTKVPAIMSDFIVLNFADLSFNSGFLERHVKGILNRLVYSESRDDLYKAIALYWSVYRFLDPKEVNECTNAILDGLSRLEPGDQARFLLLMVLREVDKKSRRLIRRQIDRLKRRSPDVFKMLLPERQKKLR